MAQNSTISEILNGVIEKKGLGYLDYLTQKFGKDPATGENVFPSFVNSLLSQLRHPVAKSEVKDPVEKTIEIISNLEQRVLDLMVEDRDAIMRGVEDTSSDFRMEVGFLRLYDHKNVPESLRLEKKEYTAKVGYDPTDPRPHLGHLVTLMKLNLYLSKSKKSIRFVIKSPIFKIVLIASLA